MGLLGKLHNLKPNLKKTPIRFAKTGQYVINMQPALESPENKKVTFYINIEKHIKLNPLFDKRFGF